MESCEIRMRFDEFMMMRPVVRLGSRSVPPEKGKAQLNYGEILPPNVNFMYV
jgi:hypothetical protein